MKMTQNIIFSNLDLNISNVTNKTCHLCLREFSSAPELHHHIDNDHDFRHPTKWSKSSDFMCSDSNMDSFQNSQQKPKK